MAEDKQISIEKLLSKLRRNRVKYQHLKQLANNAIAVKKVFSLQGQCAAIKDSLIERNWVQKLTVDQSTRLRQCQITDENELNSTLESILISEILHNTSPNLLWYSVFRNFSNIFHSDQTINRICMSDYDFSTKSGLCKSFENKQWCCVKGISNINIPRSYILDNDSVEEFEYDYKFTACTSLLKWFAGEHVHYTEGMTIVPFDNLQFAMDKCICYLNSKEHFDIDKSDEFELGDWSTFLENFNDLTHGIKQLNMENINYLHYKILIYKILNKIKKYNPQHYCEGIFNLWIVKPEYGSLGRGITIKSNLNEIFENIKTSAYKYVVQKYIEAPLLIYKTKFDIRQYYLITKTYPLTIWMYRNCYLRFSSKVYDLYNYHESIHLTNHAVQKNYEVGDDRDTNLPQCNMWSLLQFKEYLCKIGHPRVWRNIIYPGMKENIIGTMLCSQSGMIYRKNDFAFYGCDFVLDEKFKPWLIEINSRPDMTPTTPVTREMCPEALKDSMKVILDYPNDHGANTGNFERIYCQTTTPSRYAMNKQNMNKLCVTGTQILKEKGKHVSIKSIPRRNTLKINLYDVKKIKPYKIKEKKHF
ncbi:tubulin glycylase 3A-like [Arctopsyche grandis]|uniref:tubulin glycylase 3A-like n=1 Tax=Arctopsyche grandis TaxID=121162 RepID=UPI00406D8555